MALKNLRTNHMIFGFSTPTGSTAEFPMESLSGRIFSTDPSRSDTQYRLAGFRPRKNGTVMNNDR